MGARRGGIARDARPPPELGQVLAELDHEVNPAVLRRGFAGWDPRIGQGANQSIEDGMALATILLLVDNNAVPAALLAYERLRRERVAQVQLGARQHGLRIESA